MPQILNLSTRAMGTVTLLSPGAAQQAICTPVVYLEATIAGEPAGHSYEWVQISGTPTVTLYVVSNTQAYYLPGGSPGSDKVFRFYIDRGSIVEQYGDITVYTTPTSLAAFSENGGVAGTVSDPPYAFVQSYRSAVLAVFDNTIPFNSMGILVTGNAILSYGMPEWYYQVSDQNTLSFANRFVNTVVDRWDGEQWVNIRTATLTQTREATVQANDRIRIGVTYRGPTGLKVDYAQWYDFADGTLFGGTVVNCVENGGTQGSVAITRTIFQIVLQNYTENIDTLENGITQGVVVASRIVYALVPQTYDETITTLENGLASAKYSITRVTGGTIGG